jgi:hypothetical protein
MKKIALFIMLPLVALFLVASKMDFSGPTWDWDASNIDQFAQFQQDGWFEESQTYYQNATTDLTAMPTPATTIVEDYPASISTVTEVDEYTDLLLTDEGTYALERWEDNAKIEAVFATLSDLINYQADSVAMVIHPAYYNDGKIREDLYFENIDVIFKVEIESIQVINQFAKVTATNLYGYVTEDSDDLLWVTNADQPSLAADGIYYLIYDNGGWWFFGNQLSADEDDNDDGDQSGEGWDMTGDDNFPGLTNGLSSAGTNSGIESLSPGSTVTGSDYLYGLTNETLDKLYNGDLNVYKECSFITDEIRICLVLNNIQRGSSSLTADLAGGLENNQYMMLLANPAKLELHRQPEGNWQSLPQTAQSWLARTKSLIIPDQRASKALVFDHDGRFIGEPQIKNN